VSPRPRGWASCTSAAGAPAAPCAMPVTHPAAATLTKITRRVCERGAICNKRLSRAGHIGTEGEAKEDGAAVPGGVYARSPAGDDVGRTAGRGSRPPRHGLAAGGDERRGPLAGP